MATVMAMYAGDNMTFEINITSPVYTVVGNSSSLEGLNITFENGNITISPVLNYKPDNFTIIFFDNVTREIIYRSGGGSRKEYVDRNVTVYVPEYINITKIVEVGNATETIGDDKVIIYNEYGRWYLMASILFGILCGGILFIRRMWEQRKDTEGEDE